MTRRLTPAERLASAEKDLLLTDIAGQLSQSWNVSSEIVETTLTLEPVVLVAHLG